jgi:hypothetical protein
MEPARRRPGEDEAAGWWGPFRRPVTRPTVLELLRQEVLAPPLAGMLWAALARRAPLTVVAGPSGAGKTTLLTALLDLLPAEVRRVYVRGCYEPFAFLADPAIAPERTALLVNEISPHLPIYLWGPGLGRLLGAARRGFAVYATAHAGSARDLIASPAGYPLRLPPADIAALGMVLTLDAWEEAGRVRRVARELAALRATPAGGVEVATLARRGRAAAASELDLAAAAAAWAGGAPRGRALGAEVNARAAILRELAAGPVARPEDVAEALATAGAAAGLDPRRATNGRPAS